MVLTWAVFQVLTNGIFLTQRNLTLLALQTTITALAAISAVMLIVTRNFDLSVGSAVALVGVVVAWLTVRLDVDPLVAVPVAIAVGLALGAWNGWWVTRVGVPSFIVTLAGLLIFRGVSLIITNSATISPVPKSMTGFATGFLPSAPSIVLVCLLFGGYALFQVADARRARTFGLIRDVRPRVTRMLIPAGIGAVIAIYVSSTNGLPPLVLLLGACALAAEIVMRRTRFGAQLYAIGGNPEAARLAGINVGRSIFWDFVIAGLGVWHHRRRPHRTCQRCRIGQRGPVPGAGRHHGGHHRRHQPGRRAGHDPGGPPRCGADGQPQQRHEPAQRRHPVPGHRSWLGAARRGRHRCRGPQATLIGAGQ